MQENASKQMKIYRSPILLLIIVTSAIFVSEIIVMFLIPSLPPISLPATALIDSVLLVALLFPILYFSVFRQSRLQIAELIRTNEQLQTQITERDQAEQALQLERNKLKGILDAMQDGVSIINQNYLIEYINPAIRKELGPINGRKCYEYFHDRMEACPWCKIFEVSAGKSIRWERYSPKTEKTYDLFDAPIIGEAGTISKLTILRDITQRKHAEEVLKESEKQLHYLSSQLLTAHETERRRISRELHDELGQALAVLKLRTDFIKETLYKDKTKAREECERSLRYIDQVIENVRRLSRDLSPPVLEDVGLTAAIKWLVKNITHNYRAKITLNIMQVDDLFSQNAKIMIYRIIQEALTNIVRHAEAKNISVTIGENGNGITFLIEDDGKGFNVAQVLARDAAQRGLGLKTMDERVRMLRGNLDLRSEEEKGTQLNFTIPTQERLE